MSTERIGRFTGPSLQAEALPSKTVKTALKAPFKPLQTPIQEIQALGGIISKSSWYVGSGNFKQARRIPQGATVYASWDGKAPENVRNWFALHPRARNCIAVNILPTVS